MSALALRVRSSTHYIMLEFVNSQSSPFIFEFQTTTNHPPSATIISTPREITDLSALATALLHDVRFAAGHRTSPGS